MGRLTGASVSVAVAAAVLLPATALSGPPPTPLGQTTVEQRIVPNSDPDFRELSLTGPGEAYTVREEGVGTAQAGRQNRRQSLLYFGQLSDFQLADEESPARVEFADTGPFGAAWRPWEALNPQIDDEMIRQVNAFSDASPVADGSGDHAPMSFTINTGDAADSQQRNEATWVRQLLEGGPIDPSSGVDPGEIPDDPFCVLADATGADAGAPENYTGVQDPNDYAETAGQFYYPDGPNGAFAAWPSYPGLLDRAQDAFTAQGLDVPSYMAFGNHDALVQGNAAANAEYERVATGCLKPMSPAVGDTTLGGALGALTPASIEGLFTSDPTKTVLVPPDPDRQFVSKPQYKEIFEENGIDDGHGFDFIGAAEETASGGAAGYYSWSPRPGFRFIALDTVSEAGVIGPSADGNIDDPQYQWLTDQLEDATDADELVVLFSHHGLPSLTADVPDESAPPCTGADPHGHDNNPGCDLDPRASTPIHLEADMETLLLQYPHVVAWVAGHSHVNAIEPHPNGQGGGFWSVRVAAEADWPQQSRLLEIFDNEDGTLSIFGTILDHAAEAAAPAAGTAASGMTESQLASIGRTLSANDTQSGAPNGEGAPADRNVELLISDPRGDDMDCSNEVEGTSGKDRLEGTSFSDRIRGRAGNDRIRGEGAGDCLFGARGNDHINGNAGDDQLRGASGRDVLRGGKGGDLITAGARRDRVKAVDGRVDTIQCGAGRDLAIVDPFDGVAQDCERVRERSA